MLELAIDAADLRVLVPLAIVLLIGAAALLAAALPPRVRLERPAGLEDWQS